MPPILAALASRLSGKNIQEKTILLISISRCVRGVVKSVFKPILVSTRYTQIGTPFQPVITFIAKN